MVHIDQLIRSRRKSIGLVVTSSGQFVVRAPHSTPVDEIRRLVDQKSAWINRKLEFFRSRQKPSAKAFVDGESFLFLGRSHTLKYADNLPKAVVLDECLWVHAAVKRNAADHIRIWYQNQAMEYIADRVKFYAAASGLKFKSIKLNNARTRWGSCSSSGALNFAWRLIMAPPRIVDYVVVHELMHLKQMNHTAKFWNEVKCVIPDYHRDERWLKEHGNLLVL